MISSRNMTTGGLIVILQLEIKQWVICKTLEVDLYFLHGLVQMLKTGLEYNKDLWKVSLSTNPSLSWSFLRWKKHSLSRGSDLCRPELQMAWQRKQTNPQCFFNSPTIIHTNTASLFVYVWKYLKELADVHSSICTVAVKQNISSPETTEELLQCWWWIQLTADVGGVTGTLTPCVWMDSAGGETGAGRGRGLCPPAGPQPEASGSRYWLTLGPLHMKSETGIITSWLFASDNQSATVYIHLSLWCHTEAVITSSF